jgi:hypothetical protein
MLVKQADAINSKFVKMKSEMDSLKLVIKELQTKSNCDSLKGIFEDLSFGPTFIYNYKNSIYTLDLSLYKIKLNTTGRVKMKKMSRWEIGRYFEIRGSTTKNVIDWKEEFREYELPLLDSNKELVP